TIWSAIRERLVQESTIYVGDQGRCPYGPRSAQEIQSYSEQITGFLLSKGCKLIVIACNTATAASIAYLRQRYEVAFVGLEPALKPAVLASKSGKVGILATEGTFSGQHFKRTQAQYGQGKEFVLQVGHGLVAAVEKGELDTPATQKLLESYLKPMLSKGVDQIVLGCTHYPLLRPAMEKIVAGSAEILDPSAAIARRVEHILTQEEMLNHQAEAQHEFYTSGDHKQFTQQLYDLMKIQPEEISKSGLLSF
ncbi:MAG: glutamate racemase, partial [Bacteroidota bacterium]